MFTGHLIGQFQIKAIHNRHEVSITVNCISDSCVIQVAGIQVYDFRCNGNVIHWNQEAMIAPNDSVVQLNLCPTNESLSRRQLILRRNEYAKFRVLKNEKIRMPGSKQLEVSLVINGVRVTTFSKKYTGKFCHFKTTDDPYALNVLAEDDRKKKCGHFKLTEGSSFISTDLETVMDTISMDTADMNVFYAKAVTNRILFYRLQITTEGVYHLYQVTKDSTLLKSEGNYYLQNLNGEHGEFTLIDNNAISMHTIEQMWVYGRGQISVISIINGGSLLSALECQSPRFALEAEVLQWIIELVKPTYE